MNATRTASARSPKRRTQPRTVSTGRPSAAATVRAPAPAAFAASAAPITVTTSARRNSANTGSRTCDTPHKRQRDRRGRTATGAEPPRSTRARAHPHGPSGPPQSGHASSPLPSRSSTQAASAPTVSTAPPRATRPSRDASAREIPGGPSYALIGTVPPPTNTTTDHGTHQDPSAHSMPEPAPDIGIPSAAQHTATDLGTAMPPVAGWRNTRLPATMSAADVTALLDACDRSQPSGLRDLAILTLLARLGLRSGEVAALQLGDIDWRAGEIVVRGKARCQDRLPLTVEAGEAIAGYLRDGRPRSRCPKVILTLYAPYRGIHPSSITRVVYRACQRAGLPPVGGHRLRHALASEMLRQGSDLIEISQVLRHRDLATTSVYAQVDRAALRTVARPWPGAGR